MSEDFDAHLKLQQLYADMSDSKLLEMAENIDDLTEVAQNVLREELARRGLNTKSNEQPATAAAIDQSDLIVVHEAKDTGEAQRLADTLENAGIRTLVTTQRIEYVDGTAEDKPVVKVVYLDRERAYLVLYEVLPRDQENEVEEAPQYAVCPTCHSPDIVLQSLDSQPGGTSNAQFNWSCDACGHQWIDDGLEQLGDAKAE